MLENNVTQQDIVNFIKKYIEQEHNKDSDLDVFVIYHRIHRLIEFAISEWEMYRWL